jgi:pyoverdine/dityrosine biosynthesis protein Dit1
MIKEIVEIIAEFTLNQSDQWNEKWHALFENIKIEKLTAFINSGLRYKFIVEAEGRTMSMAE